MPLDQNSLLRQPWGTLHLSWGSSSLSRMLARGLWAERWKIRRNTRTSYNRYRWCSAIHQRAESNVRSGGGGGGRSSSSRHPPAQLN